jgi:DNA-binding NarL/FixJ family response regulator
MDDLELEKISVLIADDSTEFREGLRALLEGVADLELVGEAATGEEAVHLAVELQPDVILMDINMPGLNGIEATRQIVSSSPHISVLVLTMFENDDLVFTAVRAGAQGYLLKGTLRTELVRSLRSVRSGGAVFGPGVARKLMSYFAHLSPPVLPLRFPELTERERQVLDLMAQHLTNSEIAQRLSISEKTVRNQVSNILNKLQVADRAQAIVQAQKAGLGHQKPGAPHQEHI